MAGSVEWSTCVSPINSSSSPILEVSSVCGIITFPRDALTSHNSMVYYLTVYDVI